MSDNLNQKPIRCTKEGCTAFEGGSCAEDYEQIEECGYVEFDHAPEKSIHPESVKIKISDCLSLTDFASIDSDRDVESIALIGSANSGKTTFIASLFYEFNKSYKGFSEWRFKDSLTFLALNEKLHYVINKCNANSVEMIRTSLKEDTVYHFKTIYDNTEEKESIWIDIPGEELSSNLAPKLDDWKNYKTLKRVKKIIVFFDGDVIQNAKKRGNHIENIFDAISNSLASETWGKDQKIMLTFSKSDTYDDNTDQIIQKIVENCIRRYSNHFKEISFCKLQCVGGSGEDITKSTSNIWHWALEEKSK